MIKNFTEREMTVSCLIILTEIVLASLQVQAQTKNDMNRVNGADLVRTHCASCHAIGMTDESPFPEAPPFRILQDKWPLEQLEESLAEGIMTGHAAMPEFEFTIEEVEALMTYLKSLNRQ